MPDTNPFSFALSRTVAPIVCMECGGNAHCFRREPRGAAELQSFRCDQCGAEIQKVRGEAESDAEIERQAGQSAGTGRRGILDDTIARTKEMIAKSRSLIKPSDEAIRKQSDEATKSCSVRHAKPGE